MKDSCREKKERCRSVEVDADPKGYDEDYFYYTYYPVYTSSTQRFIYFSRAAETENNNH